MTRTRSARLYRRLQAVWMVARGHRIQDVAHLIGASPASIYGWISRYRKTRRVEALMDAPRSGRPSTAAGIPDEVLAAILQSDPMTFGYAATGWTVALLRQHVAHQYGVTVSARTLRRRLHALGWRWKRPRYVYREEEPHRAQKKGGLVRRLKHVPSEAAILFEDETTLRWFPPLRASWAPQGTQAQVPITGQNAKRVLCGTINLRTGHRVVLGRRRAWQQDFQAFLRELRWRYRGRPIYLLLDAASCHTAGRSRRLAEQLGIVFLWLPKQCPELNAMDHLWRELKGRIAANHQYATIDDEVAAAEAWVLGLTPTQARRKAGILSARFWLRELL